MRVSSGPPTRRRREPRAVAERDGAVRPDRAGEVRARADRHHRAERHSRRRPTASTRRTGARPPATRSGRRSAAPAAARRTWRPAWRRGSAAPGTLRVPRGIRHSAIASPLGCCRYHATSAVPAASTSTAGVSPVPGRRVSFAEAVAGRTRRAAIRISRERRIRVVVAGGEEHAVFGRLAEFGEPPPRRRRPASSPSGR